MMTAEKIDESLDIIETAISFECDPDNPHEQRNKLHQLSSLIVNSASTVADAKYLLKQAELAELRELQKKEELKGISATGLRMILESKTAEQRHRYDRADRYNAAMVHCMEAIRSGLSYMRTELEQQLRTSNK